MTVRRAMKRAGELMEASGLESPLWQARVLAAHVLGLSPAQLVNTAAVSFSHGNEETLFPW